MDPKRRRELALGGVAVLLIAVAAWSMQRTLLPASGASAPVPASPTAASGAAKNPTQEINLTALKAERAEPEDSTRNPFRFKPKPVIRATPSAAVIKQQQKAAAAAAEAASAPLAPPPPPPIPLKYIGDMMDPKNSAKRIAILSDPRNTYYGREGDVVEGRYRILRIGVESV